MANTIHGGSRVKGVMKKVYLAWRALDHPGLKDSSRRSSVTAQVLSNPITSARAKSRRHSISKYPRNADKFGSTLMKQCRQLATVFHRKSANKDQNDELDHERHFTHLNCLGDTTVQRSTHKDKKEEHNFNHQLWPNNSSHLVNALPGPRAIAGIKIAIAMIPPADFLTWIVDSYSIESLLPNETPIRLAQHCQSLPIEKGDFHSRLVTLMGLYNPLCNPKGDSMKDRTTFDIMQTIYSHLKYLFMMLEHDLNNITERHNNLDIRDFVMWCYDRYKLPDTGGMLGRPIPWNPHAILSPSRIIQEAIAYYEHAYFVNHDGDVCIFARHIVYLLRGARDWRERQGDLLISQHPTPAEIA